MTFLIAIPAAGASRRMRGRDKLLEEVDGIPLLRRQTLAALSTGHPVTVLLPPNNGPRASVLDGLSAARHVVPDADTGMSASLRGAARLATGARGLVILLPDVPGVGQAEIEAVIDLFKAHENSKPVVRATDLNDVPGTPIVFPPRLVPRLEELKGDDGGRSLLKREDVLTVAFPDSRATLDLDTPEDWDAWRASR